jgi:hypothetical protein
MTAAAVASNRTAAILGAMRLSVLESDSSARF